MHQLTTRPTPTTTARSPRVRRWLRPRGDAGMATAEYAIGTCAAAGLGGILFKLLTGDGVMKMVESLISKALSFVF
jgi:hypothetical protein